MEKKCAKCKKTKPISEFHKSASKKDGYQPRCKQCRHDRVIEYKRVNLAFGVLVESKRCPKCGTVKSADEFYPNVAIRDGLSVQCRECDNDRSGSYYKAHSDDIKKQVKQYAKSDNGMRVRSEYRHNSKAYKNSHKNGVARYRNNFPEKAKAHWAVANAVLSGKLPPVKSQTCRECKQSQAVYYHHYKGYEKENRLKVIPVCHSCHAKIHDRESHH